MKVSHDGDDLHWTCFHEDRSFTPKLGDGFYQQTGNPIIWRYYGDLDCYVTDAAQWRAFHSEERVLDDIGSGHMFNGACVLP